MTSRLASILPALVWIAACSDVNSLSRETTRPTYDPRTGRLIELTFDANGDGRIDTWTAMDGARPLQARIDRNQDGRMDRWEEYDQSGRLLRVGYSRPDDGRPDAWAYATAEGKLERVDLLRSADDPQVIRREFYDTSAPIPEAALARAEEDTDGDGRMDKWETFGSGALKTAAWDENGDGIPDRRVTYDGSAAVLLESEPDATGRFTRRVELRQ